MNIMQLSWQSLLHRRFATVMTSISIAFSVALLLGVERIRDSGKASFGGAISRTDLIVGPRTGDISLLLYSVFRIGSPSQSIDLDTVENFTKHPAVEWTVPFSLGDGYRGFPVIATSKEFFTRYKYGNAKDLSFSSGVVGDAQDYVVLGALVAHELQQKIGDKVIVAHGHSEDGDGFEKHEGNPLTVTGVLEFTGTPVDRGVWISLESMAKMHDDGDHDEHDEEAHDHDKSDKTDVHAAAAHSDHDHDDSGDKDDDEDEADPDHEEAGVSGFFLGTKDRSAALSLMREINEYDKEPLTAIMPAVVLNNLWRTLAVGEQALGLISAMVAVVGICGMWVSLHILAHGRKREIAVLRASGASPNTVIGMMTGESVMLCLAGIVIGMCILYGGLTILTPMITKKYGITIALGAPSAVEFVYLAIIVAASAVAGFIPALQAYRGVVKDGLSVRF